MDYNPDTIKDMLRHALSKKICLKHPVGALIETLEDDERYVFGWNGAPSKIKHNGCNREGYASGEGMEKCPGIHAERRAISRAARNGILVRNGTIYLSEWFPCSDCAKSIVESNIIRLVTPDAFYQNKENHILLPKLQNQPYNFEMAEKIMREAELEMIVDPRIRPY